MRNLVFTTKVLRSMLLTAFSLSLASSPAFSEGVSPQIIEFNKFADARAEILNLIGAAKKRIWLYSDYITDGEIVTALYVAQYRKVSVQVLLGRAKAKSYMSRLRYLKKNNIPVLIRPASMKRSFATALLIDNRLFNFDSELNSMSRKRSYKIHEAWDEQAKEYIQSFAQATTEGETVTATRLPLVGRKRNRSGGVYLPRMKPRYNKKESHGAYTYDKLDRSGRKSVPKKLPGSTIWEKRIEDQINRQNQRQRAKQNTPTPLPTVTPTPTPPSGDL